MSEQVQKAYAAYVAEMDDNELSKLRDKMQTGSWQMTDKLRIVLREQTKRWEARGRTPLYATYDA